MMASTLRQAALTLVLLGWACTGLAAKTHALLIGSGEYGSDQISDLEGPGNDLAAMRRLVTEIGADRIVVLEDAGVTRSAVERALFELGNAAAPGDWLLLYYSGHGSQGVAQGADQQRVLQFVPLHGFEPDRQDPEHFIVDKDFYAWLQIYVPSDVNILMMVDSCHSGTMQRAIRPELYGYVARTALGRGGKPIELVSRPGPRFAALVGVEGLDTDTDRSDLPNLVYFGASRDGQLALEMQLPVAGETMRGLLTYAFEQGLTRSGARGDRRAADLDHDGVVSVEEMAAYLNGQVHMMSAYRQDSTATFGNSLGGVPLLSDARPALKAAEEPLPSLRSSPPLDTALVPGEQVFRIAEGTQPPDFRWDRAAGHLYRRSGDLVAEEVASIEEVAGAIGKWQAVAALSPLVAERAIRLELEPNGFDWLHEPGARIALTLRRPTGWKNRSFYATVFNLASDGTVQLLYPLPGEEGRLMPGTSDPTVLELEVTPPFGTDHLIALATDNPAPYLRAALQSAEGQRAAERIVQPVQEELRQAATAGSLVIFEVYTGRN